MGALPRPGVSAGPHRELVEALHDLHHRAGWPSLRRIAADAGCSHTTVSHILSSPRVPAWDNLRAVVEALGGDPDEFHRRWLAVTSPTPGEVPDVPLVGRQDELAVGHGFFRDQGRLLVLQGEAGSGKTRLLEALAASSDRCVLGARCVPLSRGEPLMPLAAVLRTALRVEEGRWLREALDALPEFVVPSLAVLLPELGDADRGADVDGVFARHRLFTAACLLIADFDRRRPCLVQLDDLHWADDSTRDFLSFAMTYDQGPPILCAWRVGDPEGGQTADDWRTHTLGLPGVTTIPVGPLDEKESLAQLRWLGIDNPDQARALHQRSGGLPLFTEHLARSADTDTLPDRLADLLTQRLRNLPHQGRRVADTLALLDRPATADHLPDLTGLARDDVTTGLHHLADRHLLHQTTDAVALSHPLLAQAARDTLLPTERLDHHRRIATALEHHPDAAPSEIALHWRATGDTDRTLPWEVRAALAAERRFALTEASEHWVHALNAWPARLPAIDDPPTTRSTALLHALRALFQVDRAGAVVWANVAVAELDAVRGPEEAAILDYAAQIANVNGDRERALELARLATDLVESDPPSAVQADVLHTLEFVLEASGRDRDAKAVGLRMAEVCAALDDDWRRWKCAVLLASYAEWDGDAVSMRQHLAASTPSPERLNQDPISAVHLAVQGSGLVVASDGRADEVWQLAMPALHAADSWGIDSFLCDLLKTNVAMSLRREGRLAEVGELVEGVAHEVPHERHAGLHRELAALDLARGRVDAALHRAMQVADFPDSHLYNLFETAEIVTDILLWAGRPREALDRALVLLATTEDTDSGSYAAALLTLVARAGGDLVGARLQPDFDVAAGLRALQDDARVKPFDPHPTTPSRLALHAQWRGELGRIDGKPDVEAWSTAIRRWDELGRPFDAAYCRWRAAQACLQLGQATAAARLLRRGLKDARAHAPLRDALTHALRELAQNRG